QHLTADEICRDGRGPGLAAVRSCGDHGPEYESLHTRGDFGAGRQEISRRDALSTVAEPTATERVVELTAREEERFRSNRQRSDGLWKQAKQFITRGVPSSFQDAAPQPVFVDHRKGTR